MSLEEYIKLNHIKNKQVTPAGMGTWTFSTTKEAVDFIAVLLFLDSGKNLTTANGDVFTRVSNQWQRVGGKGRRVNRDSAYNVLKEFVK